MNNLAFWLTPKGKILTPQYRHIIAIIKFPKQFGETEKTIQDTYDKYDEKTYRNIEGKAREDIMMRVIKRGFIRIRKGVTRSNQHWSIQLNKLTNQSNDVLWTWANMMMKKAYKERYNDVIIHEIGNKDKMTRTNISEIASGKNIKEDKDSMRIYEEDEIGNLPRWVDYAHEIDPECLSEQAKIEILAHSFRG